MLNGASDVTNEIVPLLKEAIQLSVAPPRVSREVFSFVVYWQLLDLLLLSERTNAHSFVLMFVLLHTIYPMLLGSEYTLADLDQGVEINVAFISSIEDSDDIWRV